MRCKKTDKRRICIQLNVQARTAVKTTNSTVYLWGQRQKFYTLKCFCVQVATKRRVMEHPKI